MYRPGSQGSVFVVMFSFLRVNGQHNCLRNIGFLRGLLATRREKDQRTSAHGVIHTVARSASPELCKGSAPQALTTTHKPENSVNESYEQAALIGGPGQRDCTSCRSVEA